MTVLELMVELAKYNLSDDVVVWDKQSPSGSRARDIVRVSSYTPTLVTLDVLPHQSLCDGKEPSTL